MEWRIEEIPGLKGYTVEWAEPGLFYLSRRNVIYRSENLRPPFEKIAEIDTPMWKRLGGRLRLGQRLLRFMVTNVIRLSDNELFVTFDRAVGIVRDGRYQALGGLFRPCRVLRSACAVDARGNVFFGEYLLNNHRGEIRVYRYEHGSREVNVIYTFPAGSIRHVHGLYYDKFSDSIFCLTGDVRGECRIARTPDEFRTLETVGEGDESWRAVSILFTKDSLFYGTDAEKRANNIYQVNRRDLSRKNLGEVTGTVFYSKQIGGDLFFATTAENAHSQKENAAALWHVGPAGECTGIAKFPKDRWHPTLFQFGTIHFPYANKFDDQLFFHLVGVEGDNGTFKIQRPLKLTGIYDSQIQIDQELRL